MALGVGRENFECIFWYLCVRRCQRVKVTREQDFSVPVGPAPLGAPAVEMLVLTLEGDPTLAQVPRTPISETGN